MLVLLKCVTLHAKTLLEPLPHALSGEIVGAHLSDNLGHLLLREWETHLGSPIVPSVGGHARLLAWRIRRRSIVASIGSHDRCFLRSVLGHLADRFSLHIARLLNAVFNVSTVVEASDALSKLAAPHTLLQ